MTTATDNTGAQATKPEPNPYNQNKSWHQFDDKPMDNANSLFVPPKPTKDPNVASDGNAATPKEGKAEGGEGEAPLQGEAKRYFDLKKYHDKTVTELREEKRKLEEQIKNVSTESFKMPKTEDELKAFQEKNPDLFDTIIAIARQQAQKEDETVKTKLTEIEQRENKLKATEAAKQVAEAHSDFEQLKVDDQFHEWAENFASKATQEAIYNNPYDAQRAIEAIDLFKLWRERNGKQKSSASSTANPEDAASLVSTRTQEVGGTQKKVWTREEINKMSLDEYEKNREAIFAQLKGR